MPRMSSRLARIEPSKEACTMAISSATRAMIKMMSSTAFPKVTFNRAPMVSPISAATHSVAYPSIHAKGIMATAFSENTTVGEIGPSSPVDRCTAPRAIPTGTKSRNQLTQLDNMMSLTEVQALLKKPGLSASESRVDVFSPSWVSTGVAPVVEVS